MKEFEKTLRDCTKTAEKAYKKTKGFVEKSEDTLNSLNSKLCSRINKLEEILSNTNTEQEFFSNLRNLQREVEKAVTNSIVDLRNNLQEKRQYLKEFTVTLFGRTKAGKSTIREALTCGDGSTIGKGGQRTTRDVISYNWKGLRVIDTPGLEAYQGEDDAKKARGIVDQSDIVLFLTTDDSVHPGEFEEMAKLVEMDKYFIVLLNVKENIKYPNRLEQFLAQPEKLFDPTRLEQHKARIREYAQKHLSIITRIDIIPIHALAAFNSKTPNVSTREKYQRWSDSLWQLSKVEHLQEKVILEVNAKGKHHRVCTFFNGTIYHVDAMQKMLMGHCQDISQAVKFIAEEKETFSNRSRQFNEDSLRKIKGRTTEIFHSIGKDIPSFVDEYIGKPGARQKWNEFFKEKVEKRTKELTDEIKSNLMSTVEEFRREYKYDVDCVRTSEAPDISVIKKGQTDKILEWTSCGISGVGGVLFCLLNFWNPAGWAVLGTGLILYILSWFWKRREERIFKMKKEDALKKLLDYIERERESYVKKYKDKFEQEIMKKFQCSLDRLGNCIYELKQVKDFVRDAHEGLDCLKTQMYKELFAWLLRLEGVKNCNPKDIRRITHNQEKEIHIRLSPDYKGVQFKKAEESLSGLLQKRIQIKAV